MLRSLDGRPFAEYRRLLGRHRIDEFDLYVDHVPPDPYAGGARVRLAVARERSGLPADLPSSRARRLGCEDFVARAAAAALDRQSIAAPGAPPGSGGLTLAPCGPAMLERSTARITDREIEVRLSVDLPAVDRRIRGLQAEALLRTGLGRLAAATLLFSARRREEAGRFAASAEDHAALQAELARQGLVAFVADGSFLVPEGREDDSRAESRRAAFAAPPSLARSLALPGGRTLRGLAIPAGVTVVVGGTMHGKSTFLRAIAAGVHPHPPGDGREGIATLPDAAWVQAEPGRSIRRLDLSSFLLASPTGGNPADVSSEDAGGSLSQAAGAVEAIEAGSRLLLVDEDASAVGFLIRDGRMQRLVPRRDEPVVALADRAAELHRRFGVSTIVAAGAAGDFLDAADTVILLDRFHLVDAGERTRELSTATRGLRLREELPPLAPAAAREPFLESAIAEGARVGVTGRHRIRIGEERIDLEAVPTLVEGGQIRALAHLLLLGAARMGGGTTVAALLDDLEARLDEGGVDALDPTGPPDLARPRRVEIAAALGRWRALRMRRPGR